MNPSVLVIGAGVIGSVFAAKFTSAGCRVTIAARGIRLGQLRANGLVVKDETTGRLDRPSLTVVGMEELGALVGHDFTLVAVQRHQLPALVPLLVRLSENTVLITMVNSVDALPELRRRVNPAGILAGFPGVGGRRLPDGTVEYRFAPAFLQKTTFGEMAGGVSERSILIAKVLKSVGVATAVCEDMSSWQATHVGIVSPIADALYAAGGNLRALASDRNLLKLMVNSVREVFAVLPETGHIVVPRMLSAVSIMPEALLVRIAGFLLRRPATEALVGRHALLSRQEMTTLRQELLHLFESTGIKTPKLKALAARADSQMH